MPTPPPLPRLQPYFQVRDMPASIAWFEKLGFELTYALPGPDGAPVHAELNRGPLGVMVGHMEMDAAYGSAGLSLYFTLNEDIDALYQRAQSAGVSIAQEPADQFWGDRLFAVDHPDGYRLMFAQHVRDVSPEEMARAAQELAPTPA